MDLSKTISKSLKTIGKVVKNAERDIVVTKLRDNVEYNPTTGEFNHVNPKTYRVKGVVMSSSQNEQDLQRQRQDTKLVLIAYADLPVKIDTSDKLSFDDQTFFVVQASIDAASSLHRINVRAG
jgi:hypothetical protein